MQFEIDISKLERGTHEGQVKVVRNGKTFWRKQRVGQKEKPTEPKSTKEVESGGFATSLKVGDSIKFFGNDRTVTEIRGDMITLSTGLNYPSKTINENGLLPGKEKPKAKHKDKPKETHKPKAKPESTEKIVGDRADKSLSGKQRKLASENMENFIEKLSEEEKDVNKWESVGYAAMNYTAGRSFYMNGYLRTDKKEQLISWNETEPITPDEKERCDREIELLDKFLTKAPKVDSTSYRGMSWDMDDPKQVKMYEDFMKNVKLGSVMQSKSYSSTTTDKATMEHYSSLREGYAGVRLHIESKTGVYLDGQSQSPEQQEILLGKDVKFEVVDILEPKGSRKHTVITLKEV